MAKSVLLLSTYPIILPRHGGQIRLNNIQRCYKSAGMKVISLAVYNPEHYSPDLVGTYDIPLPIDHPIRRKYHQNPYLTDLMSGEYAAAADGGLPTILSMIPPQLDVIQLEQPWLLPLVIQLKKLPEYASSIVVYGSQNIEWALKQEIFRSENFTNTETIIKSILDLESNAARIADVSLAVTPSDLEIIKSWGTQNVELIPNGTEPWEVNEQTQARWREKLPRFPWLLYVGSAHPPNFTGFENLLGYSLGCVPPSSRIVIAGDVTSHIYRIAAKSKWSVLNQSRLQLLFTLSDDDLAAVKSLAHGFILPLLTGGGSNIKTAEALYSGSYVVGTPAAFRGFEHFMELPEVRVASDATSFQKALREVFTRPPLPHIRNRSSLQLRETLSWDYCLKPLPTLIEEAIERKSR
jgi:hypothetical protein